VSFDNTSEKSVDLDRQENITKGVLSAKKVALYTYDAATDTLIPSTGGSSGDGAILDGVNSAIKATVESVGTMITNGDFALVTNSVIHGLTTGGGGAYVDVKVNPSGALTVENTPATSGIGTVTTASVTTSNTTVLASNNSRMGATIYNEGTVTALVKLGSTASATSYTVKILQDGYYEVPFSYTGIVTGITASGTATCRVSELT